MYVRVQYRRMIRCCVQGRNFSDSGAFMAAFGSDTSSERCRKLIRRRSEDLGEYIS